MVDDSINISKNRNSDEFLKKKNKSNISTNANNLDKSETKIVKPRSKPSESIMHKLNTKPPKVKKRSRMQRKSTSGNILHKIKLNHKYSSANDYEKNKVKDKEKKKISILKLLTTKNLFKDDKDKDSTYIFKQRNSVSKHILSIQQYNQFNLKKNSINSPKDQKDNTKSVKPSSELSLKLAKVDEEFLKKSNKNLRHNELDKSFVKKCSFNSNMNIPRIAIKTQENDTNEIHLVVKGKEETIINYTNQQMIKDEKDYMIQCLKVLAKLKKEGAPRCKQKVNFNFPAEDKQKKIALFDLDETLVHCNNNAPGMNGDEVSVKLPTNKIVKVGLNIRNNWKKAFDLIKNHYHIVIFTASHPSYADAVLDYLDKENKYFKYRLYRSHCIQCDVDGFKFYVKDLDTLDKYYNLKDIVIIDNSILSFAYHLYNGIPIIPFINQPNDTELMFTAHYLVSIANYDDLSLENKKHLNLDNLLSMAKILNEIEGSQEEEEEEEDENCIIKTEEVKNPEGDNVNDNGNDSNNNNTDSIKNGSINESKTEGVINFFKKDTGETSGGNVERDNNTERKKFTERAKVKKDRKTTIKIAEDMKKNIDEMLNKKKKELEKIDENK
jgi:CTD small phosphatase-like protein 2